MPSFLLQRCIVLLIGLTILAFGVALSIHSHLGTSPISSIPYSFSYFIPLSVGTITILMHVIFVLLQMAILGKDFHWLQWSQLLLGIFFGVVLDIILYFTQTWQFDHYLIQLSLSLLSCLLTAIGICFMVKAKLLLLSVDGFYQALVKRFGYEMGNCKTIGDCIMVAIAALGSFLMLNEVVGVREGTVITALLVGSILKVIRPYFDFINFDQAQTSQSTTPDLTK